MTGRQHAVATIEWLKEHVLRRVFQCLEGGIAEAKEREHVSSRLGWLDANLLLDHASKLTGSRDSGASAFTLGNALRHAHRFEWLDIAGRILPSATALARLDAFASEIGRRMGVTQVQDLGDLRLPLMGILFDLGQLPLGELPTGRIQTDGVTVLIDTFALNEGPYRPKDNGPMPSIRQLLKDTIESGTDRVSKCCGGRALAVFEPGHRWLPAPALSKKTINRMQARWLPPQRIESVASRVDRFVEAQRRIGRGFRTVAKREERTKRGVPVGIQQLGEKPSPAMEGWRQKHGLVGDAWANDVLHFGVDPGQVFSLAFWGRVKTKDGEWKAVDMLVKGSTLQEFTKEHRRAVEKLRKRFPVDLKGLALARGSECLEVHWLRGLFDNSPAVRQEAWCHGAELLCFRPRSEQAKKAQ
jgi:hypothetical protein